MIIANDLQQQFHLRHLLQIKESGKEKMKVTYVCDICGKPQETVEIDNLHIEKLGIDTLTNEEKEDIIKYNDEQGLLLYSLCPSCFEEGLSKQTGWID